MENDSAELTCEVNISGAVEEVPGHGKVDSAVF